jgi:hypothetical protein
MSTASDIADGVVTLINQGSYSKSFTAKRVTVPSFELETLKDVEVHIWPESERYAGSSRSGTEIEYLISLALRAPVDPYNSQQLDELLTLVEEIQDTLLTVPVNNAGFRGMEADPLYNLDTLDDLRAFVSVLSITYIKVR